MHSEVHLREEKDSLIVPNLSMVQNAKTEHNQLHPNSFEDDELQKLQEPQQSAFNPLNNSQRIEPAHEESKQEKPAKKTKAAKTPHEKNKKKKENVLDRYCPCKKSPILIVDDDIFNIMTLKMIIKEQFQLIPDTASNGLEAFEAF